jgi:ActR/RegA family two-component response regulator
MEPINGDKVVAKNREFNQELYILLLTGYKDMAPPLETIRALEIQG